MDQRATVPGRSEHQDVQEWLTKVPLAKDHMPSAYLIHQPPPDGDSGALEGQIISHAEVRIFAIVRSPDYLGYNHIHLFRSLSTLRTGCLPERRRRPLRDQPSLL